MKALPGTIRNGRDHRWWILGLTAAAGPICYGLGLWAASLADGHVPGRVVCFDPTIAHHLTPVRVIPAVAMAVGSALTILAAPWLLGTLALRRLPRTRATAGAWSLAANSAALVGLCLVLRTTVGIDRTSFLAGWLVWTGVLLVAAGTAASTPAELRELGRRYGIGILIGAAAVALGIAMFHPEHFLQCFNGDGTEQFELARSLRDHFLPYWEIETTRCSGTYIANPTVFCSYWTLPWQLLLGEGELASRLPTWLWWLGVFAVSLRMVQGEDTRRAWLPAVVLALGLFLTSLWYTFYAGYFPYMTDPASPGTLDALFTLCLLLALHCLQQRDCAGWVVWMVLGSLIFYAGTIVLLMTTAAAWFWQPVSRRQLVRAALAGTFVIAGIVTGYLAVGCAEGSLEGWWRTLYREGFDKYSAPGPRWPRDPLFLGYFLLGCGGIPAIALFGAFRKRKGDADAAWAATVATVTWLYLLFLLGSGHKNLHYLGPLLPIPLILWLRRPGGPTRTVARPWAAPLLAACGLAVSICLSWPAARPVFTLNRQLGAITTFQTDSYEEACRWGRIAWNLYSEEHFGWPIGKHTWIHYAQLDGRLISPRPLVVTDRTLPLPRYRLVFESDQGIRLYSQDPDQTRWAAEQREPAGMDRWPPVFQPIAIQPRAREVPEP